jgi:hypothetical protein
VGRVHAPARELKAIPAPAVAVLFRKERRVNWSFMFLPPVLGWIPMAESCFEVYLSYASFLLSVAVLYQSIPEVREHWPA